MKLRVEQKDNVKNSIGRVFFVVLAIGIEVWIMVSVVTALSYMAGWVELLLRVISVLTVLAIYGQHKNSAVKMPWIMLILALPIFGLVLYLLLGSSLPLLKMKHHFAGFEKDFPDLMPQDPETMKSLEKTSRKQANESRYLMERCSFPVYRNTDVVYYASAADGFEAQKEALKKAENFIFMEYFAIEDAQSFASMKEILKERAGHGVKVRVFYDDIGSMKFLNHTFIREMEAAGIQCRDFNPVLPAVNVFMNNRDHRKMTIIDGIVGFTGGYNLADEYFNITHPFGFWKDTGVRLTGDAVHSMTVMFLEMWNASRHEGWSPRTAGYLAPHAYTASETGWIQPYADTPLDLEHTGENVYMNLIDSAERYLWISTPYLIPSDETVRTLALAAGRGVDVRIITPGIPDKKLIYSVTRSYYSSLVREGVRIFEYTPGFNHAKMMLADDETATVGTFNMDFRSLYLHFEDGVLFHRCSILPEIRRDFEQMFADSTEVTEKYLGDRPYTLRIWQCILRLFAPLF